MALADEASADSGVVLCAAVPASVHALCRKGLLGFVPRRWTGASDA